ncbi:MAG: zf-HC2 domain-containing protein [Gammaproteobacteria bacterium]|nr:zf-HC2 domain-containing protein [Gammaproteobacteria bacterium]
MLCEHANSQLIEYAEGVLDTNSQLEIERHVEDCDTCQSDYAAIQQWRSMATNWHQESPPAQQHFMPVAHSNHSNWWGTLRHWFPTFASATALVLVTVMYVQQTQSSGVLPSNTAINYDSLPKLPQATQAAVVDSVLKTSRDQRQAELSTLLKILTAEMNRRSADTENSLRYIISTQIQGQKELDLLYGQLEVLLANPENTALLSTPDEGVSQ